MYSGESLVTKHVSPFSCSVGLCETADRWKLTDETLGGFCPSEQLLACRAPLCKSKEMTLPPFLGQMVPPRPAAEELSMCRFAASLLLLCSNCFFAPGQGQFASRLPELLTPQLQRGSLSLSSLAYVLWAHLSPGRCCGLIYILPKRYMWASLPPGPQNVTSLGNRVFADVIS